MFKETGSPWRMGSLVSLSLDDDTEERISSTSRLACRHVKMMPKSLFDLNTCIHKCRGENADSDIEHCSLLCVRT